MILGLETSCDETAAALVTEDGRILANVVASQAELHARYGGVVPEVASRRHLELVVPGRREALSEADAALDDVETVAVTRGPGLIGALLVGLSAAKALAWARRLPLVAGRPPARPRRLALPRARCAEPPFLCLLASGGHTLLLDVQDRSGYRVLGTTLDDAAGEAFDKGARLLGLGYPGGAELDRLAREGDPEAYGFPVARVPGLDFSFSGLKTALLYEVRDLPPDELERAPRRSCGVLPACDRHALVGRTREAAEQIGAERIAVVGGVAANSELRAALPDAALAPLPLCTDNAAMIASAARFLRGDPVAPLSCLGCVCLVGGVRPLSLACSHSSRSPRPCSRSQQARARPATMRNAWPPSAWRGLVGAPRQEVAVGQRVIVVLNTPVARRPDRSRGRSSRRSSAAALDVGRAGGSHQLIARPAQQGVRVRPEYFYARVFAGFSRRSTRRRSR